MYFDVTIITGYRVGTDSLCKYMSKHPEIYCPGYYGTKFRAHEYSDKTFTDIINCKRNVFIWHDGNTDFLYSGDVPIKHKYLIHPVRHPYEQMIANYNASLQQDIISNNEIVDIGKYIMQGNMNSLHCSLSYSSHYCNYEKVKVVDFSNLSSVHINKTMNDIYQWLGLEACANFENDISFKRDHVDFFLKRSPLLINHNNINWAIYFIRHGQVVPKHLYPIGVTSTDELGMLTICISKGELYANRLQYHGLTALDVELMIDSVFLPWVNRLEEKLELFQSKKISSLPSQVMAIIDDECQDYYNRVCEYYPEIDILWRDKWTLRSI